MINHLEKDKIKFIPHIRELCGYSWTPTTHLSLCFKCNKAQGNEYKYNSLHNPTYIYFTYRLLRTPTTITLNRHSKVFILLFYGDKDTKLLGAR